MGAGSGVGFFSNRTLSHPSFWPLYEAASRRELGEQAPRDAGIPVLNCEEVFVSDPLLPCGYHVPLYLDRAPQQVMNPLKLLLPPPIMSSCVVPTSSSACSTNWLSELEMVVLKALLQMSQEGSTCSPSSDSMLQANCLDFVSSNPAPHGGPRYSHFPDPPLPQTTDTDSP
ncbi:PREDICTED: histone deacetylase complex subunit SAP25-like [Elephantulus edwardii]|uniref:histone deacetylase complex subunit SAP25-like n=1 Tax=Elephantulus edwardii TaxID=28737 RepID=UPI0003F0DD51|nr:PREDICTED: histone deacetylase complex subunit SAP25-like [Elephantulus edwardii]